MNSWRIQIYLDISLGCVKMDLERFLYLLDSIIAVHFDTPSHMLFKYAH